MKPPWSLSEKDSAPPLRTRRLCGELVFGRNSTAETQSTQRLRREKAFFQQTPWGRKEDEEND